MPFDEDRIAHLHRALFSELESAWDYPHVVAVVMVGLGVYEYRSGDYWDSLPNLPQSQRTKWGRRFERFLESHESLETFKSLVEEKHALRYVAPILAHGGVPRSCLAELLDLMDRYGSPEESGSELLAILQTKRLYNKPITRFVSHGGEVAEDLVSRLLALWNARLHGESAGGFGLPNRIAEEFSRWFRELEPSRREPRSRFPSPTVLLDPRLMTLELRLPRCVDHRDAGDSWEAEGGSWPTDRQVQIPLPPAASWRVVCGRREFEFRALTMDAPIVFFEPISGHLIRDPSKRRLPSPVWAVWDRNVQASPLPVHKQEFAPWPEHRLGAFELDDHECLKVGDSNFEVRRSFFEIGLEPRVRRVSSGPSAIPVYDAAPRLQWQGLANLSVTKDGHNLGNVDISCADLATLIDEPGEYEIKLRGPLGQNLEERFVLIPGLAVEADPELMWPSTKGVCFSILLAGASVLEKYTKESRVEIEVSVNERSFDLCAKIPCLEWRLNFESPDHPSGWSTDLLIVRVQELKKQATPLLVCRLPLDTGELQMKLEGQRSGRELCGRSISVSESLYWHFDLRLVSDMILLDGEPERFEIVVEAPGGQESFRGPIVEARSEWDMSNLNASWRRDDSCYCIELTWRENGPVTGGRWLIIESLWRPKNPPVMKRQLALDERDRYVWLATADQLPVGRYRIRAIHAPWGIHCSCEGQQECFLDIHPESWPDTFCFDDTPMSVESYLEGLLAHWHRRERVRHPPPVPRGLSTSEILEFLEGIAKVDQIEAIRIPRDGSGALNIFCINPEASATAVAGMKDFPSLWKSILPTSDILTASLGAVDQKLVFDLVLNFEDLQKNAKAVRNDYRQADLCPQMRSWHRQLKPKRGKRTWRPPVDDLIFLCERYGILKSHSLVARQMYAALKAEYQSREAV